LFLFSKEAATFPGRGSDLRRCSSAAAIRQYHLLHPAGGPDEHDIARPAEFLVDSSKIARWTNFTEDIRLRARTDELLAAAQHLK